MIDPRKTRIHKSQTLLACMDGKLLYLGIRVFHVTLYQANFACHHTRNRHVGLLSAQDGIGEKQGNEQLLLLSSYHITK